MVLDEGRGGGHVIEEPAETAVIEIQHLGLAGVDQQVGEAEIGMDKAKAAGVLPVALQALAHQRFGPFDDIQARLLAGETGAPVAPDRLVA
ncbi:hypothetical protein D9M71_594720 [compost metagenome]